MTTVHASRPSLAALAWPVHTERLALRPATSEDLRATWQFPRLHDVSRWLTQAPATLEQYRGPFLDPASLAKSLVIELDGDVIGDLMLSVDDAWGQAEVATHAQATQAELGWVLHPAHSGRGYATEAVRELLRIGFEDLSLRRLTATCLMDNVASWRLMARVGMRREVHAHADALHRSGRWMDTYGYAILAGEHRRANTSAGHRAPAIARSQSTRT